jgi:FtsZ-binding cell division protein ZapB
MERARAVQVESEAAKRSQEVSAQEAKDLEAARSHLNSVAEDLAQAKASLEGRLQAACQAKSE